jgi:hypothetical protein
VSQDSKYIYEVKSSHSSNMKSKVHTGSSRTHHPDDGGSINLLYVDLLRDYTALYPSRL